MIRSEPMVVRAARIAEARLTVDAWVPATEADRDHARSQLAKMLAHPLFANSKRYPALLRHVVESSLEGRADNLKERTLGIEVFGRKADYDTNLDPVVRITAGEIRKRIAQYYHEPQHEAELRIDLPAGSYVPQFHLPLAPRAIPRTAGGGPGPATPEQDSGPSAESSPRSASRLSTPLLLILASGFAAVIIVVVSMRPWSHKSGLDLFWGPILEAPGPVLLSIGEPAIANDQGAATANFQETVSDHIRYADHIVLPDATLLVSLSGFLGKAGKPYRLQGSNSTTLTDLRQGPTILISAFDNPWTVRLTEPLRFHFVQQTGSSVYSIEDRQDPENNRWSVDFASPYAKLTEDYALVARYWDGTTGQLMVVAGGISTHGTISAAEFLTEKRFLDELFDQKRKGTAPRNIEVVIATSVIDGKSGPPRVEAVHFW